MSALTLRYVMCDGEDRQCAEDFTTGKGGDGITAVRKAARIAGWSHPDGWTDYCPMHGRSS